MLIGSKAKVSSARGIKEKTDEKTVVEPIVGPSLHSIGEEPPLQAESSECHKAKEETVKAEVKTEVREVVKVE